MNFYEQVNKFSKESNLIPLTLEIINSGEEDLRNKETYYIKIISDLYPNNKYNIGNQYDSYHSDESYDKMRSNNNGVLPFNTDESIRKSLETQRKSNGGLYNFQRKDVINKLKSKEIRIKAIATNKKNHNGVLSIHTPEAMKKCKDTQRKNNGGVLPINIPKIQELACKNSLESRRKKWNGDAMGAAHTKEAYLTQLNNHGGKMAMHTDSSLIKKGCLRYELPDNSIVVGRTPLFNLLKENGFVIPRSSLDYICNTGNLHKSVISRNPGIDALLSNCRICSKDGKWSPLILKIVE